MANLSAREKSTFSELFEMSGGYVVDFSNNTFASFVADTVNIDVYNGTGYTEYASKANKLRQIWNEEPDAVVGMLNQALLEHVEDRELRLEQMTDYKRKKIGEMRIVCQRLLGNAVKVDLPKKQEDTLQILLDDINNSLARNQPTLVLDRLHTFSTKLLRGICTENGITVTAPNGDYLPIVCGKIKLQQKSAKSAAA